jgi:uncharacterized membrane protein
MGLVPLLLVLTAAVAHATWNLLAKRSEGGVAFVWLYGLAAVALFAPAALVQLALEASAVSPAGLAFMAGSGVLHAAYFTSLQRGYATGDLSLVYPLARATGPLLSVTAAVLVLGERPGLAGLLGAALIVAAVLGLVGGRPGGHPRAAIGWALLTGTVTAAYTVWDAHAVTTLGQPVLLYFWGAEVTRALLLAPVALRRRRHVARLWRAARRTVLAVGLLSPLAYVLVLAALALAPVSAVAPAREVSIVIGAALGANTLGEGHGRRRVLAAGAILAGIALLALA